MTAQAGTVYRYLRVDADHDVSTDILELSRDKATWFTAGVDYIPTVDRPASCIAADAAEPPTAGFGGYWWRILTGPSNVVLNVGSNHIYGRLPDLPETPHFAWTVTVHRDE